MQNEDMKSCSLRNVEASSAHQDCIYLIKNTEKINNVKYYCNLK